MPKISSKWEIISNLAPIQGVTSCPCRGGTGAVRKQVCSVCSKEAKLLHESGIYGETHGLTWRTNIWIPRGGGCVGRLALTLYTVSALVAQLCPTLMTPWTVARQAPLSMVCCRRESWSGLPFSTPRDLPNSGIEPRSPTLQEGSLLSEPPGKPHIYTVMYKID